MANSTFRFSVRSEKIRDRDAFFERIWSELGAHGLLGIHEGTVLSDDVEIEAGATQSFARLASHAWRGEGTVDSGVAPVERDWVGNGNGVDAELYFGSRADAEFGYRQLQRYFPREKMKVEFGQIEEVPERDWDAEWKASFLNDGEGVEIPPYWRVVPPWFDRALPAEKILKVNPGAGFGTGTHETTQLCLTALAGFAGRGGEVLDFGSGSGILGIAAAKLGFTVKAVEIDPLANENARENAQLNGVTNIGFFESLGDFPFEKVDLILANILRPVLLEFAPELTSRLKPGGGLILSGLIERDVEDVISAYRALLPRARWQIFEKNEWRALVFRT